MSAIPMGSFADLSSCVRVHYHDLGAGPPVVFLHGSGPGASGYSNFKQNFPALSAHHRLLAPDALGFGLSSKPEDVHYSLRTLCDVTIQFVNHLGLDRFALVGNSLGGAMAIQLALDLPDRVSRLVLMAPGGLETRERYMDMEGIRGMMRTVFARGGYTRDTIRELFALQLWDPAKLGEETLSERLGVAQTQPRRIFETLSVPYLTPELGRIACPVLALWGREDKFCPISGAETLRAACRDVRVVEIPECGHWVMAEYPELFNREAVAFLAG